MTRSKLKPRPKLIIVKPSQSSRLQTPISAFLNRYGKDGQTISLGRTGAFDKYHSVPVTFASAQPAKGLGLLLTVADLDIRIELEDSSHIPQGKATNPFLWDMARGTVTDSRIVTFANKDKSHIVARVTLSGFLNESFNVGFSSISFDDQNQAYIEPPSEGSRITFPLKVHMKKLNSDSYIVPPINGLRVVYFRNAREIIFNAPGGQVTQDMLLGYVPPSEPRDGVALIPPSIKRNNSFLSIKGHSNLPGRVLAVTFLNTQ